MNKIRLTYLMQELKNERQVILNIEMYFIFSCVIYVGLIRRRFLYFRLSTNGYFSVDIPIILFELVAVAIN